MNITYIIGNGFDLGLGLNTRYSDFVEFLSGRIEHWLTTNEKSGTHDEKRFVEWLENKIVENKHEFWHDAEEAFGGLPFSDFGEQKRDAVQFCLDFSKARWQNGLLLKMRSFQSRRVARKK